MAGPTCIAWRLGVPAVALLGAASSCGGGERDSSDSAQIVTSHQELCAGAPPEDGTHVVTSISCPFVQHTTNIDKFGVALANPTALRDARGATVATVTNTCDVWAMGTDAQGVTVLVRLDTGEVVSHGLQHPGQPLSQLASPLASPLLLE